jgi:hypothetical protein
MGTAKRFTLSSEPNERRKVLAEGVAFVLNAYLKTGSVQDPTELAASALATEPRQDGENFKKHEAELRAMAGQIRDLKAKYEGGSLAVYLDRKTALELIERMLRKAFARQEAAATATFKIESGALRDVDHDGELALPNRSIYVKFVPEGSSTAEFANSYLEKVRSRNPSEYWLFAPNQEKLDIPFEPVFTEGKVTRGRLRVMGLATLISDIVGDDHVVAARYDVDEGYKFIISKKRAATSAA